MNETKRCNACLDFKCGENCSKARAHYLEEEHDLERLHERMPDRFNPNRANNPIGPLYPRPRGYPYQHPPVLLATPTVIPPAIPVVYYLVGGLHVLRLPLPLESTDQYLPTTSGTRRSP